MVVASIFILFPCEHQDMRESAVERFYWTMERFSAMRERNSVARAAQGVLAAIHSRFIKAVGHRKSNTPLSASAATSSSSSAPQQADSGIFSQDPSDGSPASTLSGGGLTAASAGSVSSGAPAPPPAPVGMDLSPLPEQWGAPGTSWVVPQEAADDMVFSALAPLYPTYELLYNDLVARGGPIDPLFGGGGGGGGSGSGGDGDVMGDGMVPFLFDGDFDGDNTFWQLMNLQG